METNIKALLLRTDCFIKNTYFRLYIKLLEDNATNKKIKGYTNRHHCIPLTFFTTKYNKTRREAEIDSKQFGNIIINLKFSDHIKAHYYLALCMTEHYKYGAISSLNYLIGNFNNNTPNYTIDFTLEELQLDKYQELYELGNQLNIIAHTGIKQNRTKDWNKKISISNTGKKKINNGNIEKAVNQDELQSYLDNNWVIGPLPFSETRKEKARQAIKKASEASRLAITGENNPAKRPEVKIKISQKLRKAVFVNNIYYDSITEALKILHWSKHKFYNKVKKGEVQYVTK